MTHPLTVIVMGVSGCGKSTLAGAIAGHLSWPFVEGDDYHSPANRRKMASGQPLDDSDRRGWIAELTGAIRAAGPVSVVACSALNPVVRSWIESGIGHAPLYLLLDGDRDLLTERLKQRTGHFMNPALLDSQLAALRPPEDAVIVPVDLPQKAQLSLALEFIRQRMSR
ncbi:MAG: gluconokinase [Hyphomonas sp.]